MPAGLVWGVVWLGGMVWLGALFYLAGLVMLRVLDPVQAVGAIRKRLSRR